MYRVVFSLEPERNFRLALGNFYRKFFPCIGLSKASATNFMHESGFFYLANLGAIESFAFKIFPIICKLIAPKYPLNLLNVAVHGACDFQDTKASKLQNWDIKKRPQ